ncbi:phospholipase C, phosphocholine-specific [Terriglobus roseus DSM 18391]|uniref:phospholipase C n=1 Tax=Terriglobus roseus (strain DSM 18391 / NRRL B-41598 / KBS 63) TaxID=926566 RepID=I3ZIQ7_TERRK|nr:phospholipase C, phosphocholine-specific [Terriglobus roseus]AFL89125.1 phospholipase C, phosphocholine-specific [Terriglobus roseus DSM 18391]
MTTRRDFLRTMAATAASASLVPPSIARAMQILPSHRTGTIRDVEHVVILMQENRSFDHYFGTMRGVRGFGDPRPALLPNSKPVWHQPVAGVHTKKYKDRGLHPDAKHVLPFYINPQRTTEFQAGTDHGWSSGHLAWNEGRWDQWINQKQDVLTMGHLRRQDLGYHYALADAFTLCDSYFCSVHGNTAPNRVYLWSGTIDAANAYGKRKNGPGLEERHHVNGYTWSTYPERLEKAGVSWKLYQGGSGVPGEPVDNYTDNSLEFFANYQVKEGADPNGRLVRNGVTDHTLREFREDIRKGQLSQVSWIVPPYKYSEHPEASPTDGAYYLSLVMDALTENPEVWSKTVFLINYDENDGLFDHVVPPMPPSSLQPGSRGMVSESLHASLQDEFVDVDRLTDKSHPLVPGADPGGRQPIGLGPRVPLFVVSPWSSGGWVNSQVFDHTSVLQFLEKRFRVDEPNISAWRRAVCGDLTSAFDFSNPGREKHQSFPAPKPIVSLHEPYSVPKDQVMPVQETGTRPSRALPYALTVNCHVEADRVWLELANRGKAGAAFYVYDRTDADAPPRRYTVAGGDTLKDFWMVPDGHRYDLAAYGPGGFLAHQAGIAHTSLPVVTVAADANRSLQVSVVSKDAAGQHLKLSESYTKFTKAQSVDVGANMSLPVDVSTSGGWYDLSIEIGALNQQPSVFRRYAGRIENGEHSHSDPFFSQA